MKDIVNAFCVNNIEKSTKHFLTIEYIYQCLIRECNNAELMALPPHEVKQMIMNSEAFDFREFRRICFFRMPNNLARACGCEQSAAFNVFLGYAFKNKSWGVFEDCPCTALQPMSCAETLEK